MNRTLSMLNGYVGESIVDFWLRKRFPGHELAREVLPIGIPPVGGPTIDFGVLMNDVVEAVYEVKTQDYTFDGKSDPGKGLSFAWSQMGCSPTFKANGRIVQSSPSMTVKMICLRPPNAAFFAKIGNHHIKDIMLFQEVWADLTLDDVLLAVMERLRNDIGEILRFLSKPAGSAQAKAFLDLRRSMTETPVTP